MRSPEEHHWEDEGIVSDIMSRLMINPNSRSAVMNVLRNVLIAEGNNSDFDATEGCKI